LIEPRNLSDIAAEIDVIDLAGQIIADPRRARVSTAGQLALASAVEAFWAISVEANVLVRALALSELTEAGATDQARQAAIAVQADTIRKQLAAISGQQE